MLMFPSSKFVSYNKQAGAKQCQAQGSASFELLVHIAKLQLNILFVLIIIIVY